MNELWGTGSSSESDRLTTSSSSSSVSSLNGGGIGFGEVEVISSLAFFDLGPGRYLGVSSGSGEVCLDKGRGSKGSDIPAKGSPPSLTTSSTSPLFTGRERTGLS